MFVHDTKSATAFKVDNVQIDKVVSGDKEYHAVVFYSAKDDIAAWQKCESEQDALDYMNTCIKELAAEECVFKVNNDLLTIPTRSTIDSYSKEVKEKKIKDFDEFFSLWEIRTDDGEEYRCVKANGKTIIIVPLFLERQILNILDSANVQDKANVYMDLMNRKSWNPESVLKSSVEKR